MTPRLKSLELHGYKTFASRSIFEFPKSVTAIVGPNGSGKSNIADSIRWVLGEQSFTLLRGRKTEDMIFSGSEQRSRAGMASATIVFDNEDGWLPIDYSEVSITRRAYRDGQNEYLLNGQRVRLKEISELLAQSGLSERTYTIIGQGLVDAALSLRPEERRRFFEEAAGIRLYRRRREESLTRLESTRRNLERVMDIISEIEPRLGALEKQARRAQEHERIQADLRLLLRDWYGYHWHKAQGEVQHAQDVFRVQEERVQQSRQRQSMIEQDLEKQRAHIQALRSQLNEWHVQSAELHRQREKISRSLAVMDERFRSLVEQQQGTQSDLARMEEEYKNYEERKAVSEEEKKRLLKELSEAQTHADEARQELQKRQAERAKAERALGDSRRLLVSTETSLVQTKARQSELLGRMDTQQKALQALTQKMEDEVKTIQNLEVQAKDFEKQQEKANTELQKAEQALQEHRTKLLEVEEQIKLAREEISRYGVERAKIKAQLDVLEQAEKSMSGLNQGARHIIETSRKGQLRGKIQAISSNLIVPEKYEMAIASLLGEFVDGLWLDENTNIDEILMLLETGEKGRAVLLPQDSMRIDNNDLQVILDKIKQQGDYLGIAIDLVEYPDNMRKLFQYLLGCVILVKNRATAKLFAESAPSFIKLVTLQGEIFWGNGVVIAGRDSRSSVIARPRQRMEYQESITAIEKKIEQISQEVETKTTLLAKYRTDEQGLNQIVQEKSAELNRVVKEYQKINLSVDQARQHYEWQYNQQQETNKHLKRSGEEVKQIGVKIKEIEQQIETLQEQVRQHKRLLSGLPTDDLQTEEAHWKTNVAVVSRAVQEIDLRIEEFNQLLNNNVKQQDLIEQKAYKQRETIKELEDEKNEALNDEKEMNDRIDALRKDILPTEQNLTSLEKTFTESQEKLKNSQQSLSVSERNETQSQLELTRRRDALDTLRRRIEEDFGLVAFEYASSVSGPTPLPLGDMVEQLPVIEEIAPEIEDSLNRQKAQLRRMGAINPEAQQEFEEVSERYKFLKDQVEDLQKADIDLRQVIADLDELMKIEFHKTFNAVATEFRQIFSRIFNGGVAKLVLTDEDNPVESGIDIEARLPGRREQGLALLSGGERSLTAVALVFSLLRVSPTPFCVFDEVDAMLDESNVGRFCDLLKELSEKTQFIVVTHNRGTVQASDVIYGITMGRDSASRVISLRLDEVDDEIIGMKG